MENETKQVRKIKRYANRKLYDMTEKKYITFDELSELIKTGEDIAIEDNETGEDITASVVAQLLAKEKKENNNDVPSGFLIQMLRMGGNVVDYAKKYTSNALTMGKDEIDKLVSVMVKSKELSESEGNKLKKEIVGYAETFKGWISEKIETGIKESLNKMNLVTKEQVIELTDKVEELGRTVEKLQKQTQQTSESEYLKNKE